MLDRPRQLAARVGRTGVGIYRRVVPGVVRTNYAAKFGIVILFIGCVESP